MPSHSPSPLTPSPGQRAKVIGHRGAPGSFGIPRARETRVPAEPAEAARYGPENTLHSFERALALGADVVELDVRLSADEQVVVIHDDTVERTTDGTGRVADLTLHQLQALDAGAWFAPDGAGQRLPTLEEALAWARGRVSLAIELKTEPARPAPLAERVAELVARHGMADQVVVISFDHPSLARVRALAPTIRTGLLYVCRPVDPVALAARAGADALLPHWSYVTAEDVAAAHAAGLAVAPWVTSDPATLRWLVSVGVDAIGTNHPDRLRSILANEPPR